MKALVINDTSPGQHLGCILVMQRLADVLRDAGVEILAALRLGELASPRFQRELARCDIMIINGEGTMHHDAPGARAIARAGEAAQRAGVPIALINTVWQDNDAVNALLPRCQWISARESLSAADIAAQGQTCHVVPDLTLCTQPADLFDVNHAPPDMAAPPVVLDDVRPELSAQLAAYARYRSLQYMPMAGRPSLRRPTAWKRWWQQGWDSFWAPQLTVAHASSIQHASIVVTGRFHGMCLATLARRPFIAFASNTHKMEGMLADAQLGPGAVLLPDPPHERAAAMTYIDDAVQRMRTQMALPGAQEIYKAACDAYMARARRANADSIAHIATHLRRKGEVHA